MAYQLVLSLHGVGAPPAHVPDAERPYWMREEIFNSFVSRLSILENKLGISVVLTFDDGNNSDWHIAAPRLRKHNLHGVFFPCAGRLGHSDYLGPSELRDLASAGFEIGSHGMDHVPWTTLTGKALTDEIAGSKAKIENILGKEVRSAALPFGAYNRRVLSELRTAGYGTVYSSDPGFSNLNEWFRRRWPYRADKRFDLAAMAADSASFTHRLLTSTKGLVKSLR